MGQVSSAPLRLVQDSELAGGLGEYGVEREVWVLESRGIDCFINCRVAWRLSVLAAALFGAVGCTDGNNGPAPGDGAPHSSHSSTGPDCVGAGQSCADADCCEGRCQDSVCMAMDAPHCAASGQDCSHTDCCQGSCQGSICVPNDARTCAAAGEACTTRDCCEGTCGDGTCMSASAAAGLCAQIGQDCSTDDCCSGVCEASVCVAHATCVPRGGDCSNRDCCEGSCEGSICG